MSLIVCFSCAVFAQSGNGKVTGKVLDGATNETLIGVSVKASGTSSGAVTSVDGSYILSLPAGTYTLTFQYIGYQTKEISEITVKAGQSTFQNIILEASSQALKEVVIKATAKKESQSTVYSAQKRSQAASDGISQEAIRRTPDNNAAQVLTRVTGVNVQDNRFVVVRGMGDQYNQTMVNGVQMTSTETNRNAFSFDLIPAAVIDNIVVNKTATPDMPGNFAGGVVQVNTKDFPDNNFFSVSMQGGYSDKTYGKEFYTEKRDKFNWLGFNGSSRDLPTDFPTSQSRTTLYNMNPQELNYQISRLPNNLIPVSHGPSGLNEQVQLGYGRTINFKGGNKIGIIAALNQRKTELIEQEIIARIPAFENINTGIYEPVLVTSSYSDHTRYNYASNFGAVLNMAYSFGNNKITLKNLYTTVFRNNFINRPNFEFPVFKSLDAQAEYKQGVTHFTEYRNILNSTLGGEHRTGENSETRLNWNINATANTTDNPDSKNYVLARDTITNRYYKNPNASNLQTSLGLNNRSWFLSKDLIYGGAFNITTPINVFNKKHLLKGGILFQNRSRNVSGTVLALFGNDAPIDKILNPGDTNLDIGFAENLEKAQNYTAGSSLLAAYESIENKIAEKWRIIWGLRVENYQQNVNIYAPAFNEYFIEPDFRDIAFSSRNNFNFLPSVNVVYSPITAINIRAAYSNTVIRPELVDLVEFDRYDFQTLTNLRGNRYLKSSAISNYDVKIEWFPSAGEIISIGAFNKKMLNPIEYSEATTEGVTAKKALNTGQAYVRGIEAEIRKKIDFIPFAPWLSHVSLFGNGTLLKSKVEETKIFGQADFKSFSEHTLTGQANYIVNGGISLLVLKNTLESTLSLNRTGDYINTLGSSDLNVITEKGTFIPSTPHYRVSSRSLVDFVLSKSVFKRKGQIRFKATNLLNKPFILYQDLNDNGKFDGPGIVSKPALRTAIESDPTIISGTENTTSYIRAQRTYSLSVAYTF